MSNASGRSGPVMTVMIAAMRGVSARIISMSCRSCACRWNLRQSRASTMQRRSASVRQGNCAFSNTGMIGSDATVRGATCSRLKTNMVVCWQKYGAIQEPNTGHCIASRKHIRPASPILSLRLRLRLLRPTTKLKHTVHMGRQV